MFDGVETTTWVEKHLRTSKRLGYITEWQGRLAFDTAGVIRDKRGEIIGERPIEMQMLGPLDYIGAGEIKAGGLILGGLKNIGTKNILGVSANAMVNVTTKARTADQALNIGLRWLGPGYKEIGKQGSGIFVSANGQRIFRMANVDLLGSHGNLGSHVHYLWYDTVRGAVVNAHTPIR